MKTPEQAMFWTSISDEQRFIPTCVLEMLTTCHDINTGTWILTRPYLRRRGGLELLILSRAISWVGIEMRLFCFTYIHCMPGRG